MILYSSNARDFKNSVDENTIVESIEEAFISALGKRPAPSERRAWTNSMQFMERVVRNSQLPDDCGILIEFTIPGSSSRVDFIVSGKNDKDDKNFVIVELKQWERATSTNKDNVVNTYIGGGLRDLVHPSYQAFTYRQFIEDMNTAVQTHRLKSHSCAYLHNYSKGDPEPLLEKQYEDSIKEAPVYFKEDVKKLQSFLKKHVGNGEGMEILYQIENGKIKPSKKLMNYVSSLFKGNQEFILIDDQKIAFENIIFAAKQDGNKRTIIVNGGPGTGKSVVSINAFGRLIQEGLNTQFIAPNTSFREVMVRKLAQDTRRGGIGRIKNLFSGSAKFFDAEANTFDVLIVDEAHRLKGAGAYQYRGINQVEDIIKASKVNVFFVDDTQRIRPVDIGTVDEIKRVAEKYGSEIIEVELKAQFRCSGAEGFIHWLDTVLQIRETGNFTGWDQDTFEFRIMDSPNEVLKEIMEKNQEGWNARMLAGYAWPWTSVKEGNPNAEVEDVVIEEHDFSMPWNSRADRSLWAISEDGVNQIGCIHTSQGLEFDYVGVIVGKDLQFDNEDLSVYASYEDYKDRPGKGNMKDNPEKLTELISNIYKTLMTRGMRGCYIYCVDENLQKHFRKRFRKAQEESKGI
ncbi:MAG: DUF2075 domain-containing protein [Tissierellia bacterium]|nr:DUF2075 domain-containing protein [Tissierellia bacterium]